MGRAARSGTWLVWVLLLFACLAGIRARAAPAPGMVIVAADEWHLSDPVYDVLPPSADQFVRNVGALLTYGRPGNFLIYTDHWCYGDRFKATLQGQGHTVVQTLDPGALSAYDAVFVGGNLDIDRAALIAYHQAGGSIYLCGGTAVPDEDIFWNVLLNPLGLTIHPPEYPDDIIVASFDCPELFDGVEGLFTENPTHVEKLPGMWPLSRVVSSQDGFNWWAVYNIPSAPGGAAATALSQTSIRVDWSDTTGFETGFRVERRTGAAGFAEIAALGSNTQTFTDTGLAPGTLYRYRVRAQLSGGFTRYSNEASATTFPPPPAAPSSLTAVPFSQSRIDLAWKDNASSETGFEIERKTGSSIFTFLASVGANVKAYSDTGLTAATRYTYRVRAVNAGGGSASSNEVSAATLPPPPAAPSDLSVSALSSGSLQLDWRDNSTGETEFRIERRTGAAGFAQVAVAPADATTLTDTGLAPATLYTYRARAVGPGGLSAYSGEAFGTTLAAPPAPPSDLRLAACIDHIDLIWRDNSSSETGFEIERRAGSDPFSALAAVGPGVTAFSDTGLAAGTAYSYRVRAAGPGGMSAYSGEASAATPATATAGKLSVKPATLKFPTVAPGRTAQKSTTVTNQGAGTVTVCLHNPPAAPFTLVPGAATFTLGKGRKRSIPVQFAPTVTGIFSGVLRVRSNDPSKPSVEVSLSGRRR